MSGNGTAKKKMPTTGATTLSKAGTSGVRVAQDFRTIAEGTIDPDGVNPAPRPGSTSSAGGGPPPG